MVSTHLALVLTKDRWNLSLPLKEVFLINELQTTQINENLQISETPNLLSNCIDNILKISAIATIGCVAVAYAPIIANSEFGKNVGSTFSKVIPDIITQKLGNSNGA